MKKFALIAGTVTLSAAVLIAPEFFNSNESQVIPEPSEVIAETYSAQEPVAVQETKKGAVQLTAAGAEGISAVEAPEPTQEPTEEPQQTEEPTEVPETTQPEVNTEEPTEQEEVPTEEDTQPTEEATPEEQPTTEDGRIPFDPSSVPACAGKGMTNCFYDSGNGVVERAHKIYVSEDGKRNYLIPDGDGGYYYNS